VNWETHQLFGDVVVVNLGPELLDQHRALHLHLLHFGEKSMNLSNPDKRAGITKELKTTTGRCFTSL
jgi:hypothetical protein